MFKKIVIACLLALAAIHAQADDTVVSAGFNNYVDDRLLCIGYQEKRAVCAAPTYLPKEEEGRQGAYFLGEASF